MEQRKKNYSNVTDFLWPDLPNAGSGQSRFENPADQERILRWIHDGYAIHENAASPEGITKFLNEVHGGISGAAGNFPITYWDATGHHYSIANPELIKKHEAKVLDLHTRLASAQELIFSKPLLTFLRDIFQDDVVAFQSLY